MGKRKKRRTRKVRLPDELREHLEHQRERFRQKFGCDPGPGDPVFFDPDADEPRPINPDRIKTEIISAMEAAGVDPATIHAYRRTGMLVAQDNLGQWSEDDLVEWEAAIEEYEALRLRRN